MSSSISTRSSFVSHCASRPRNSSVIARSASSERASISGSKAATSGTIVSTSLSFRPSPACRSLLKRPMWPPSVPTAVIGALRGPPPNENVAPVTAVGQEPELQTLTETRKGWWERISPTVVGCIVAVGLALWSTGGAWGGRPPHGEDVMAYLVRADFVLPHLVAHGRLDGWFPRFYLGYPEFLFNGPGVACALGLARGMTLGALSNAGALKVVGVVSFAALPVAIAFLARSLGLGRLTAGIAAVLSLLVSSEFGPGLQGLYLIGLVSHQLGAPFFFLALGALLRV